MIRYYRYFVEMSISRYKDYVDKPTFFEDNDKESEAIPLKELTVNKNDAGQRLDRFVGKAVPLLPESLLQKYIRLKRIKLNGKGAKRDTRLNRGDVLQLYINDEFFFKAPGGKFLPEGGYAQAEHRL